MSKFVRFTKDFDHWPKSSVLTVFKKGEERRITEAQYEAANAARAVELIDGQNQEPESGAGEAGGAAGKGSAGDSSRTRAKRG